MRRPIYALLPAVALTCALLAAGCEEPTDDSFPSSTAAHAAAHPGTPEGRYTATAPPPATHEYPQGSTGPGTASLVPATTQPDVIAFIEAQLDHVNQLIQDGKLSRASEALAGLELRRSSWSRATRDTLDPKIDAVQKALDAAQSNKG